MLIRYFTRPSRIKERRTNPGGQLLEGFAEELSQKRYQWVAARKHIRAAEHFLHWIAHRKLSLTNVEQRCAQQFLDHLKRCRCRGHYLPPKPHRQMYSVDLWFAYLRCAGIVATSGPAEIAIKWAALAPSVRTRARRLGLVIRLARYLRAENQNHEAPPPAFGREERLRRTPYIYSREDVQRVVQAASEIGRYPNPAYRGLTR